MKMAFLGFFLGLMTIPFIVAVISTWDKWSISRSWAKKQNGR